MDHHAIENSCQVPRKRQLLPRNDRLAAIMGVWLCFVSVSTSAAAGPAIAEKPARPLPVGEHVLKLHVDGEERSAVVHIPENYDATQPTPVVLLFHGAGQDKQIILRYTNLAATAEDAGFILVAPDGTGYIRAFNAGGVRGLTWRGSPDDVKFVDRLLNELERITHVDSRRIYACGLSNGGMFCHRLASELSHRVTAIASVAGTLATEKVTATRPVPILHFHGTRDRLVPINGPYQVTPFVTFHSLDDTIRMWTENNQTPAKPAVVETIDKADDRMKVVKSVFRPQARQAGAEVVLYKIEGGGHTWPGRPPGYPMVGPSTDDIFANDIIWKFFSQQQLPNQNADKPAN
ncbi:alpha/beta hydrolase family esterase [Thalassoroseus pseudoceratinae]|uniref:alpha/beta hydrolase family esterase n=1 Tax=Thalassoroseus pseudoceratinae TaxID=2713176 RepID=UPI0014238F6A|nr:polyhydroxybutyrate depolymerase [Thalassoroseus pseudoceratinae]